MKTSLLLKNKGSANVAEVHLLISYFIVVNEQEHVRSQEFFLTLAGTQEASQEIEFEDSLLVERAIIILLRRQEGNVLTQKSIPPKRLDNQSIPIEFILNEEVELTPAEEPAEPAKPNFIYGRLLEKRGNQSTEDVQIIISAKREEAAELEPIAAVRTESKGYFALEYPEGYYTEAVAVVGLNITQDAIPIRLDSIAVDEENKLVFPKRLLLVVEQVVGNDDDQSSEEDCGCNSLNLDEKRILEEFSYFSLVRTSEPEIKGFVLEEEDELSLEEILGTLRYSAFDLVAPLKAIPMVARKPPVTLAPNSSSGFGGAAARTNGTPPDNDDENFQQAIKNIKIKKVVLNNFLKQEKSITKDNIGKLLALNETNTFRKAISVAPTNQVKALGRVQLGVNSMIDWDEEPTIYQSVEVAHGHILQYKTEWIADGYSLGDLLYSLPLAPAQKKQIVVFDWERRESVVSSQEVDFEEGLTNTLSRDRDVFEIAQGTVSEKLKGSSKSTTAAASAGFFGSFFGVSGGVGYASSSAAQTSLRQVASSDHQKLRDRLVQSANAVRSLRSTVIQTVSQGERFEVSSESVANYNHCHAITIQYYEVLRHFRIRQRFAGARECLFVPLMMSQFDLGKALRWREPLEEALLDSKLGNAFEAADRIAHEWENSDFPSGTFASEKILTATGFLNIHFDLRRPLDDIVEVNDEDREPLYASQGVVIWHKKKVAKFIEANWKPFEPFLDTSAEQFFNDYLADARDKDAVFHRMLGEKIARAFVDKLVFYIQDERGRDVGTAPIDASLSSRYYRNGRLRISLRLNPSNFTRDTIHYLKITSQVEEDFPESTIVIRSGMMKYRTRHFDGFLFRYQYLNDDLSSADGATIYTGPSGEELRDPRKDDVAITNKLINHLNNNLEHYHKAIWLNITPERRFMLLDGIILSGKGNGRSVASLVENVLLTIVGNSLVFPVAPGLNLNPDFGIKQSLNEFYSVAASEPINVSIPTKGVFAEAVMGHCNSCEEKDESRFWRWEESPIPDSPTAINPISTESRRADLSILSPQQLPNPVLNIQNAPAAPDPTGLAATLGVLGKGDLFRDVTGLDQTQKNALAALQGSLQATEALAKEGAKLEVQKMMEKRLDNALNKINSSKALSAEKKAELTEKAVLAYLGGGAKKEDKKKDPANAKFEEAAKMIDALEKSGVLSPEDAKEAREKIKKKLEGSNATLIDKASEKGVEVSIAEADGKKIDIKPLGNFTGGVIFEKFITIESADNEGYFEKVKLTIEESRGTRFFYLANDSYDYISVEVTGIRDESKADLSAKAAFKQTLLVDPGPNNKKLLYAGKPKSGNHPSVLDPKGFKISRGNPSAKHKANTFYQLPFSTGKKFKCSGAFGDGLHVGDEKYSIDLLLPKGEKVLAARAGIIVDIVRTVSENPKDPNNPNQWLRSGKNGNLVLIRHDDDTYGAYAHLAKNSVPSGLRVGSKVTAGQEIAKVGITGNTNGPHLHFTVQDGTFKSTPWKFVNSANTAYEPKKDECYEAQKGKVAC